jgi:hypothetical protein
MNDDSYFILGLYYTHRQLNFPGFQKNNLSKGLIAKDPNQIFLHYTNAFAEGGFIAPIEKTAFEWRITDFGEQEYIAETAKRQLAVEKEQLEYNLAKITLQTNQSVIDTNQSVIQTNDFTIRNNRRQNRLTISSIIVAGGSALFALGSVIATLKDSTSEEVRLIKQQLQTQSQIQEKMQQSQKGIDSSMKVFLEHSTNNAKSKE